MNKFATKTAKNHMSFAREKKRSAVEFWKPRSYTCNVLEAIRGIRETSNTLIKKN